MTFAELIRHLADHLPYGVLDGDVAETVAKARAGNHRDAIMGEIVKVLYEGTNVADVDAAVTRAEATVALGPLRLRYMKDDAPVEGFRMVERTVQGIDDAFNEEALRAKHAR